MSVLSKPYFHDEAAAFAHVEAILWEDGPVCPRCGGVERIYVLNNVRSKPSKKNPNGAVRHGLKKCGQCSKQFTVRIGTIFEESHIELHKWLQAIHLMVSSKKGVSAHQLHRTLEITYKSAWFLAHRIREAMRSGELALMAGERELTTGTLSKGASFRLILSGSVGEKEIERLIKKLELDKGILADAEEDRPDGEDRDPRN